MEAIFRSWEKSGLQKKLYLLDESMGMLYNII